MTPVPLPSFLRLGLGSGVAVNPVFLNRKKVISSSLSRKIRYNRALLVKEARSRSAAELDHLVNQEVQRIIEGHFLSKGYAFEKGSEG